MICPKCGKEVNDGDMVCPHCGAILDMGINPNTIFTPNNSPKNLEQNQTNPTTQEEVKTRPGFKKKLVAASVIGGICLVSGIISIIVFATLNEVQHDKAMLAVIFGAISAILGFTVLIMGQSIYGTNYKPKGFVENLPIILAAPGLFLGLLSAILSFVLYILADL